MTAMPEQLPLFACPYGGCNAYGYCPCADEPADAYDPGEDEYDLFEEGAELMVTRGRLRQVETVPTSIDHYEPPAHQGNTS